MKLFDKAEQARIEGAIATLEKQTAAEVVVAVVPHCERPWLLRAVVAFGLGLAAALVALERFAFWDPSWALFVELGAAVLGFAFFGLRPLERLLVSPAGARRRVEERAFALFARRGLYRTSGHTGVLILLSELERCAVILGDRGIHERLGDRGWQAHVDRIVRSIKSGQAAQGVVEVLAELTPLLAEIAPAQTENPNELSNQVLDEV